MKDRDTYAYTPFSAGPRSVHLFCFSFRLLSIFTCCPWVFPSSIFSPVSLTHLARSLVPVCLLSLSHFSFSHSFLLPGLHFIFKFKTILLEALNLIPGTIHKITLCSFFFFFFFFWLFMWAKGVLCTANKKSFFYWRYTTPPCELQCPQAKMTQKLASFALNLFSHLKTCWTHWE